MLPMQAAQVRSLVRELDPTCCNEDQRAHMPQQDLAQPNKKKDEIDGVSDKDLTT